VIQKSAFLTTGAVSGKGRKFAIKDYDRVRLVTAIEVEGQRIPEGATGTVLITYQSGKAFEIEFTHPVHAVVGIEAKHLTRLERD